MTARTGCPGDLTALLLPFIALALAACGNDATATSPTATSPVTETFTGQVIAGGSASHAFTAASAGTVSLTLASLGPPTDLVVGFGVGIPQANGASCLLSQSVQTGASTLPQITTQVDAGTYCVRLYDLGTLKSPTAFTVTIVRP
jgi:hypothetical protein